MCVSVCVGVSGRVGVSFSLPPSTESWPGLCVCALNTSVAIVRTPVR